MSDICRKCRKKEAVAGRKVVFGERSPSGPKVTVVTEGLCEDCAELITDAFAERVGLA